jgi:hypothetical protein
MTLGDLSLLVQSGNGWKVFKPPRFPRPTWFPELIQVPRCRATPSLT